MANLPYSPIAFSDVDLFSEWEIGLGWDIESTQLTAGRSIIEFDHVELPELLVGRFRSTGSMYNAFAVPPGVVVFAIPRAKLPVVWCGRQLSASLLGIVRSPHEHQVVLPAGWDSYEFMLSEELIRRTEIFPAEFFAKTTRLENAYLPLAEPETGELLLGLDSFFGKFRSAHRHVDVAVPRAEFLDFAIDGLRRLIDAGLAALGERPRPTRRADLLPKAKEVIDAHLTTDLTADELAQSLGVSYRVLNYAFQDAFGVSPYRYFITEKLHAVRRQLKTSDTSVIEVCRSHGFSTPSRFARQYKRQFGELPSETRNDARGN